MHPASGAIHQERPPAARARLTLYLRWTLVAAFLLAFVATIVISWHWPLIWDMQVMHYVSFLMDHGWAPYRQIRDMNMPGAYIVEHTALHIFGNTDVGWRLYDFTLCTIATLSMISIARPYDWVAGLCAGGLFTLFHAADGPFAAGQRDQVMAVLMILGFALCLEAVRRRQPWLMALFGLSTAHATAIKPTLILAAPILLVLVAFELRRQRIRITAYILWTFAGFVAAIALVLHFLLSWGSLKAFLSLLTETLPHYANLQHVSFLWVVAHTLQRPLYVFVALAIVAVILLRARFTWEDRALLLGAIFGLLSYLAQRRGSPQHRYTFIAFVVLWASIKLFQALHAPGRPRLIAFTAVAFVLLFCIPSTLVYARSYTPYDHFSQTLQSDLSTIGVPRLQHEVQCLDIVDGCLTALFHLQIVQTTGSTGDLLLFQPLPAAAVIKARADYWQTLETHPPAVIVMSNWEFGTDRDFNKVANWPAFNHYLASEYMPATEREFPSDTVIESHPGTNPPWAAYRIYIRRESPLVDAVPALQKAAATP